VQVLLDLGQISHGGGEDGIVDPGAAAGQCVNGGRVAEGDGRPQGPSVLVEAVGLAPPRQSSSTRPACTPVAAGCAEEASRYSGVTPDPPP
jgi:hypothetical protein